MRKQALLANFRRNRRIARRNRVRTVLLNETFNEIYLPNSKI